MQFSVDMFCSRRTPYHLMAEGTKVWSGSFQPTALNVPWSCVSTLLCVKCANSRVFVKRWGLQKHSEIPFLSRDVRPLHWMLDITHTPFKVSCHLVFDYACSTAIAAWLISVISIDEEVQAEYYGRMTWEISVTISKIANAYPTARLALFLGKRSV